MIYLSLSLFKTHTCDIMCYNYYHSCYTRKLIKVGHVVRVGDHFFSKIFNFSYTFKCNIKKTYHLIQHTKLNKKQPFPPPNCLFLGHTRGILDFLRKKSMPKLKKKVKEIKNFRRPPLNIAFFGLEVLVGPGCVVNKPNSWKVIKVSYEHKTILSSIFIYFIFIECGYVFYEQLSLALLASLVYRSPSRC